jgi:hypothetical protein
MSTIAIIKLTVSEVKELKEKINPWGSSIANSGWHRLQPYWTRKEIGGSATVGVPATIWYADTNELKNLQKDESVPDLTGKMDEFIELYRQNKGR